MKRKGQLVEHVVLQQLNYEEDTEWQLRAGFGRAVGVVSSGETEREGSDGRIWGKGGGCDDRWIRWGVGIGRKEVTDALLEDGEVREKRRHL